MRCVIWLCVGARVASRLDLAENAVRRVVPEFEGEDHCAIDRDGETAVAASEHNDADDELGERAEGTREGIVRLVRRHVSHSSTANLQRLT